MNTIENLIQIVETKKSEYAELELKCRIRVETNAVNLLDWVLRVAQQNEEKSQTTPVVKACINCKLQDHCYGFKYPCKKWEAQP